MQMSSRILLSCHTDAAAVGQYNTSTLTAVNLTTPAYKLISTIRWGSVVICHDRHLNATYTKVICNTNKHGRVEAPAR